MKEMVEGPKEMRRPTPPSLRGWLITLGAGVAAALIVSGSRSFSHDQNPKSFKHARRQMESALQNVDAKLVALENNGSARYGIAQNDTLRKDAPDRLRARHALIRARLDSLSNAAESVQNGAMPGLRAALADLEHRTDMAQLLAADSIDALDSTVAAWLTEVETQLDRAERTSQGPTVAGQRAAFDASRRTLANLSERFESLREHDSPADVRARRALAEELAGLRRDVRALVRSIAQDALAMR